MGRRIGSEDVESYLEEAILNIRNDRTVTADLLSDVIVQIKNSTTSHETHKDLGSIAAKYVETLQRSNEQLVKITSLLHKKTSSSEDLTEKDKNELFDLIQESG